jgi:hypothetical protein
MGKQSFLDKITGKKDSEIDGIKSAPESASEAQSVAEGEVDHLWMKEDLDAKKPKLEKDPRIDTGILRNRIADKIAKMNNH